MCLVIYLGIDGKLSAFSDPPVGKEGLEPAPQERPKALAEKGAVYGVATRAQDAWSCSCVFRDDINPWELEKGYDPADPNTAWREAAFTTLRRIARAALKVDSEPLIFSCWSGDENEEPVIRRTLTPNELRPARYVFDDVLDGGSGGNPPILIRLADNRAEDTP
jgi:hypothetical protein